MNKIQTLFVIFSVLTSTAFAQRDPTKEILIFFKEGINRELNTEKGQTAFRSKIKSDRLKTELLKLDIKESDLEVANPKFKESDTKTNRYI